MNNNLRLFQGKKTLEFGKLENEQVREHVRRSRSITTATRISSSPFQDYDYPPPFLFIKKSFLFFSFYHHYSFFFLFFIFLPKKNQNFDLDDFFGYCREGRPSQPGMADGDFCEEHLSYSHLFLIPQYIFELKILTKFFFSYFLI